MKFRPCIDIHGGRVKQIVGSTLSDRDESGLRTNFTSDQPPSYYADLYRRDNLTGGHIIMLGPGNEEAALAALAAWPGGMQIGGGITAANAAGWLARGAAAVIVTSYVFKDGMVDERRLRELAGLVGSDRLVIDLSCRRREGRYYVVTDRWQKFTDIEVCRESLEFFAGFCAEFLIHAADVEGKCEGVAEDLLAELADWVTIPTTYAGGVKDIEDLRLVRKLGRNKLDVTVGSALDIFGGSGMTYAEAVAFCREG
ncbi:MAG: phosphoribosylformimino-5-aminoimidazole carboxamide ribotide isomerase [Desulfurivibrionaceae bacterium]|nr:phosphoribosylformimino-5-aminoimidazole carboxamide ribotide isomerase [Desulfobulbales bacterium]MDT8334435.1 phosphoribosylformimino-5-aminoimidazole carboxamide ribotide isomerase [Desulfurivibrionaceae bacterium]